MTVDVEAELSAYDQGARDALRALAESFEKNGMTAAALSTRKALAVVAGTTGHADNWRCRCTYCVQARGETPEPWCPEHGYGCEPQNCPCGHSLRCDCWSSPMSTDGALPTLTSVPIPDDRRREISRAAKQVTSWTKRRNELIREEFEAGAGIRELARASGLNEGTVHTMLHGRKR